MPAMIDSCPSGHVIRSSKDRTAQGFCRECHREGERKRRVSQRMKLAIISAFEEAGVRFEDDDGEPVTPAEAVRQIVDIFESHSP